MAALRMAIDFNDFVRLFKLAVRGRGTIFVCISFLIFNCKPSPIERPFDPFGNIYRIDSIASEDGLGDPFFLVLTKDSLFNAFGYWDYSYPYETEFRIDDSLRVSINGDQDLSIAFAKDGLWLTFPTGKKHFYSVASGKYDSAYRHLRIMKTQESLLLGAWKILPNKTEDNNILNCSLNENGILRFTRRGGHKTVQVENLQVDKVDTCLRRDFRLDGSAVLIFDHDGFPPFTILKLDTENLVLQGRDAILFFEKLDK